jgi:hypothetical protein
MARGYRSFGGREQVIRQMTAFTECALLRAFDLEYPYT